MGRSEGCGSIVLTAETQRKIKRKNLCVPLRLCGSKHSTTEAKRKIKRKNLCDPLRLCGSKHSTAEAKRKIKRKNLCDPLRLCGSKHSTAETPRKLHPIISQSPGRAFMTLTVSVQTHHPLALLHEIVPPDSFHFAALNG